MKTAKLQSVFLVLLSFVGLSETISQSHLSEAKHALKSHNYTLAVKQLNHAIENLTENDDTKTQASIHMSYGLLMLETSRKKSSARHYEKAYQLAKQMGSEKWQIKSLMSLAQANSEDYDVAISWLELADKISTDKQLKAEILAARAIIASLNSRYQDAISFGEHSFDLLKNNRLHKKMALAAINASAYGYFKTEQYSQALSQYNKIIPLAYDAQHWQSVHRAYCNRAEILIKIGQYSRAEDDLWLAIIGLEQERAAIPWTNATRSQYLNQQISAYDNLILLYADADKPERALEIVERYQANNFLNLIDNQALSQVYGIDNDLIKQLDNLIQQINALKNTDDKNKKKQLLDSQIKTLQATIQKTHPQYKQLAHIEPIDMESVQFQLDSDQVIISYWVSQHRILLWIIGADKIIMRQIPLEKSKLISKIENWLKPIKYNALADQIQLTNRSSEHLSHGKNLYQWLIASIDENIKDYEHLIIIPDTHLQNLPFESLVRDCDDMSDYAKCDYLGLQKAISYNDSMTSWIQLGEREYANNDSLLAFAANENKLLNLPGSSLEVLQIQKLYPQGQYNTGLQATEQLFKSQLSNQGIIHLASHGILDNIIPMNSGLQFVASATDDGFLSGYEILNLNLTAHLTILSACQSGDGQLVKGAGIVGLSQAFLHAGSNAVLVSRWKIADKPTAILMRYFYSAYKQNHSISQALLLARQKLFKTSRIQHLLFEKVNTRYSHPRYWAGFRLNGRN
jgi:CHAT domain-containing protein